MLLFAVQDKDNGKKEFTKSRDHGSIEWVLNVIANYNARGLRTLVLIKR